MTRKEVRLDLAQAEFKGNSYVFDDGYIPRKHSSSYKPIEYLVNSQGCWECISHASPPHRGGYPVLERNGRFYRMSRYVFEVVNGYIDEDKFVMHTCDNPKCINPDHLKLGTPKENTQDMVRKGRKPIGEDVPAAKLTEQEVVEIFNDPRGCTTIAREYGISKKSVLNIRHGKTWKHLNLINGERERLIEQRR